MITFGTAFIQTQGVLSLGDFYQGGLITYLSGSYPDQHGIIMATTNAPIGSLKQSPTNGKVPSWGSIVGTVPGTFSTIIGGGSTNTQLMLSSSFTSGSYTSGSVLNRAVNEADVFTLNGYDDWVIPSNDELLAIWNALAINNIGGPYSIYPSGGGTGLDRSYWTSTQFSTRDAYSVQLQDGPFTPGGLLFNTRKDTLLNLRLIRYF